MTCNWLRNINDTFSIELLIVIYFNKTHAVAPKIQIVSTILVERNFQHLKSAHKDVGIMFDSTPTSPNKICFEVRHYCRA